MPFLLVICVLCGPGAGKVRAQELWPELLGPVPVIGGIETDAAVVMGVHRYAVVGGVPGAEDNANAWHQCLTATLGGFAENIKLLTSEDSTRFLVASEPHEPSRRGVRGPPILRMIVVAVILLCVGIILYPFPTPNRKEMQKEIQAIEETIKTSPDQAWNLFERFRSKWGTYYDRSLEPKTLLALHGSAREEDLIRDLLEHGEFCFPPAYILDVACELSQANRFDPALRLLTDEVLEYASRSDKECDRAAGIYARALKAAVFVRERTAGRDASFLKAYTQAFERLGLVDKSLVELVPKGEISELREFIGRVFIRRRPPGFYTDAHN